MNLLNAKDLTITPFLFCLVLIGLTGCNRPEVTPPSVQNTFNQFIHVLKNGSRKQFEALYFMPLHWRNKEKMLKAFQAQKDKVSINKLAYEINTFNQKGRWAVAIVIKTEDGKKQIEPLWAFYYKQHWQIISPLIFHTSTVRSMMNLYPEQEELLRWFITQAKLINSNY